MERTDDPPRIYVADHAAYNAGELHGEWIDLPAETTVDEVREAIAEMLGRSPVLPNDVAEEYVIHDYEGFSGYELDEYENLETVTAVASFIVEHGELGARLINLSYDVDEAKDALQERYAGRAASLGDWVYGHLQDTGELDEIPERWHGYIDLDRYAADLELGGDIFTVPVGVNVHVFWSRWSQ